MNASSGFGKGLFQDWDFSI